MIVEAGPSFDAYSHKGCDEVCNRAGRSRTMDVDVLGSERMLAQSVVECAKEPILNSREASERASREANFEDAVRCEDI